MITYKLAKQLKDAGFPQYNLRELELAKDMGGINPKYVKIPTFSELIEACGNDFGMLQKVGPTFRAYVSPITKGNWYEEIKGSNPEEAVAKLWLELNKVTKNKA